MPSVTDLGFTLNRVDISLAYNNTSAIVNDIVTTANSVITTENVDAQAQLPSSVLSGDKLSELNVEKLETGTISSKQITLGVQPGQGDVYFAAGKTDFTTTTAGFILGVDDSDSDKAKFYLGDTTDYMYWDGSNLTMSGSLVAGQLHIPDQDSTAASFHVDSTGNMWMGATETNKATAPVQISNTGIMELGDTGGTYIELHGPNGTVGSSNFASGSVGWQINNDGSAEFQDVEVRGTIHSSVFEYDVVSAIGGRLLVTNAGKLASDMTAADASNVVLEGNTTFVNDDILFLRAETGSGIQEEYMRVTDASGAPTYVVTRDLAAAYGAGANPVWKAGTAVTKTKNSDLAATHSGGYLLLFGEGTNSPYYSVQVSSAVGYNAFDEVGRFGNLNGVAGFSSDTFGIFAGDYDAGQYITYDSVSGDLLVNGSQLSNEALFGDGSDGNVTIASGTTTLTADMFYDNLTISGGATLDTNGYRVFVRNTLTNAGTIQWNGVDGGNGGNGANGQWNVGGGAAGSAGTAGTALSDGSLPGSLAGQVGLAGAAGAGIGPGIIAGNNGNNGGNGTDQAKCLVTTSVAGVAGGNGGSVTGGASGGTGGTAGTAGTNTDTILNTIRTYASAYLLYDPQDGTWYNSSPQAGGSGSGASGGVHTTAVTSERGASGGGGGSGGGGSAGGVIAVFARIISNTGTMTATGGAGGNGGDAGDPDIRDIGAGSCGAGGSGGGGGGAGGNGGIIIRVYSSLTESGSTDVTAGGAGTAGNKSLGIDDGNAYTANDGTDGTAGIAGVAGSVINLEV